MVVVYFVLNDLEQLKGSHTILPVLAPCDSFFEHVSWPIQS
jgi:hypothetical protein